MYSYFPGPFTLSVGLSSDSFIPGDYYIDIVRVVNLSLSTMMLGGQHMHRLPESQQLENWMVRHSRIQNPRRCWHAVFPRLKSRKSVLYLTFCAINYIRYFVLIYIVYCVNVHILLLLVFFSSRYFQQSNYPSCFQLPPPSVT